MCSSQGQASSSRDHVSTNFNPSKKRSTARMHAVSSRKKQRMDDDNQEPLATAMDSTPPGTVKANIGECAPYNDHSSWIEDPYNNTIYMFGGTSPGDPDSIPTSDFFRCDARTMEWEDITNKLRFRDPSDPFCRTELLREKKCLPQLSHPGFALMRFHGTSIIFIFGGFNIDEDKAVSTLIAVDVINLEWWYVNVEGGNVAGRINPVVVAAEQKLFIFSGYRKFSKTDTKPFQSYSIATYQSDFHRWQWEARDVPNSGSIPPDHHIFSAGMAVYNGKKILLTPGKLYYSEEKERMDFSKKKIYYFHTEHRQFQVAPHFGEYPTEVLWYSIHKYPSLPPRLPLPSRKKLPNREPGPSNGVVTPLIQSTSLPCIILCAWIPRQNKYAVPEFWRLSLSHNDEIRCLNKSQQIWDLNQDFQGCVSTNDGITLLGNNNPIGEEKWNIHFRVVLTAEDQEDK